MLSLSLLSHAELVVGFSLQVTVRFSSLTESPSHGPEPTHPCPFFLIVGDYTPTTQIDKLYCVFFLPISVAVFGEVLGRIASVYITRRTRQAEQRFLRRNMTKFDLRQMDTNDDGMVSMEEWLNFMLVSLQKVDPNFMDDLKSIFYDLDVNGNGFVDKDDLVGVHKSPQWRQIQAYAKQD